MTASIESPHRRWWCTGSSDALVPPANGRILAARIPGAELVTVPLAKPPSSAPTSRSRSRSYSSTGWIGHR